MPVFMVSCKLRRSSVLQDDLVFEVQASDQSSAWTHALYITLNGGCVRDRSRRDRYIEPERWIVTQLSVVDDSAPARDVTAQAPAEDSDDAKETEMLRHLRQPAAREREVARIYAGRRYDDFKIRRGTTVLKSAR